MYNLFFIVITYLCILNGQGLIENTVLVQDEDSTDEKTLDIPEAHFNSGYSAYLDQSFEQAKKDFELASKTGKQELKSMSFYNLGNTLHSQGELEGSLLAFRKAIELNPNDLDSKFNYELTKRLLQKKHNQKSQQSKPDKDKNDENKDKNQNKDQKQSEQKEEKSSENRPSQKQNSQEQKPDLSDKKPNAEATLNALKADEENLMKRKLNNSKSRMLEKDW